MPTLKILGLFVLAGCGADWKSSDSGTGGANPPEVYLTEGSGLRDQGSQGLWLPVDPTLNEFPANATHLRLARGGLDKQTVILPLIGRLTMDVIDVELAPNRTPILVGKQPMDLGALAIPIPKRDSSCRACCR